MRGLDLKDVLEIPPPITEENKDRYLEELSKIKESDECSDKNYAQNNQHEVKIIQHKDSVAELAKWWWLLLIPEIVILIVYILEFLILSL